MKCDRCWWNDGAVAREAAEMERWRDNWEGIKRHYNAHGELVCIEGPPCWLFFEPGYDANGSPVEAA